MLESVISNFSNRFCVILVEPEHPHNVGFVARAMRANALGTLRIVYANRDCVMRDSYRTAHNAAMILDNAKIFKTLSEALADCQFSVAFSRRVFNSVLPHVMLPELPEKLPVNEGKIALVFGRESKGLLLEEVNLCALVSEIPVPGLMSLNLAQAVSVACYELSRAGLLSGNGRAHRPTGGAGNELADVSQIEEFKMFLKKHLSGRYQNQTWMESFVHQILQRLQPSRNEMGALFGVVRSLSRSFARTEKQEKKKD